MARIITVFVERSKVPDRAALQAAVKALKFPLTLDDDYAPFKTGYMPGTVDGEDAGIYMTFGDATAEQKQTLNLAAHDVALTLKWGGDAREEAAVLAVAAAFGKSFDAVIASEANAPLVADDLLKKATQIKDNF